MGKIYQDIIDDEKSNEDGITQDIIDDFMDISSPIVEDPGVKHREFIINRIFGIMEKSENRAVMLVGEKGCGKRAIVEGYVQKLKDEHKDDVVLEVDADLIAEKAGSPMGCGKYIQSVILMGSQTNTILVINNFGHLLSHECYGNFGYNLINLLGRGIEGGGLRIIATTTPEQYDDIEDGSVYHILDSFTVINVPELTKTETEDIVKMRVCDYEEMFNVTLPESTYEIICHCADKHIKDRPFPLKAFWLLDEVCAVASNSKSPNKKLNNLIDKNLALKMDLQEALDENDYEKCESINSQIIKNDKKIDKLKEQVVEITVTESELYETIGNIVNVKMSRLNNEQTQFLKEMGVELKKNVIGQDETIDKIVKNIVRNKLGLRKQNHTIGNFIFIGSTGVGKTHLAKKLAEYLYGSEDNMIRFDMSEYQSEIDVSKLLGSPPGYVGYKESGQLIKKLNKNPDTVVLFDEIEKASPKIYEVLLQLLDEGTITTSDGTKIDATRAVIIFTSNVGVKNAREFASPLGFSTDFDTEKTNRKEEIIKKALHKRFSPEFLNRLDNICYFNSLDSEMLKKILNRELEEMNENIKTICGKTIKLTKEVEDWIVNKVTKEDNGARPIIRHLQQNIEETLSYMIINEDECLKSKNKTLKAYMENNA